MAQTSPKDASASSCTTMFKVEHRCASATVQDFSANQVASNRGVRLSSRHGKKQTAYTVA
jgi:hypothetical protein